MSLPLDHGKLNKKRSPSQPAKNSCGVPKSFGGFKAAVFTRKGDQAKNLRTARKHCIDHNRQLDDEITQKENERIAAILKEFEMKETP